MSQEFYRSPLSSIFLLHVALEIPVAIQGLWAPANLPFLQLNNTTLTILKLYAAMSLATCVASYLCHSLPEYYPGKRALAIGLTVYHSIASTILFQSPRFIPVSLGATLEAFKVTPEVLWGCAHGFTSLGFVFWWQMTVGQAAAMRAKTQ